MTRAQSMEVINDSTTLQSRIDAVLAAPIMEWDHSPDIGWQPGDPLWPHPKDRMDEVQDWSSPVLEMPHGWLYSRAQSGDAGNCPRWMMEIVGLDDYFVGHDDDGNAVWGVTFNHDDTMDSSLYYVDCDDCLVGIGDEETNCWVCGKRVRMQSKADEARERQARDKELYDAALEALYGEMFQGDNHLIFTSSSSGMRGATLSGLVFDEASGTEWVAWDGGASEDYVSYASWDAAATSTFYHEMLWGDGLDISDPSLYNTSYMINRPRQFGRTERLNNLLQLQLAVEQGLEQARQIQEFEVPRINLQETNPALYQPGYERYFESEQNNVPSPHGRARHHGRSGGSRHRQG